MLRAVLPVQVIPLAELLWEALPGSWSVALEVLFPPSTDAGYITLRYEDPLSCDIPFVCIGAITKKDRVALAKSVFSDLIGTNGQAFQVEPLFLTLPVVISTNGSYISRERVQVAFRMWTAVAIAKGLDLWSSLGDAPKIDEHFSARYRETA